MSLYCIFFWTESPFRVSSILPVATGSEFKKLNFSTFFFSIFFFDICRVYRDSFQSAKYMICFQIDKSETLVLLIFSPEFCLRDFSVTIQWFSMKFSGIMRIYENLIHLGGNVKMPFRCQVMDNFLILKWFFVSERSKERLIIWTGNLLEMIVHDL